MTHVKCAENGIYRLDPAGKKFLLKIFLAIFPFLWYSEPCCDMIAKIREVATIRWVFPGSECQEVRDQQQYCF